MTGSYFHIQCVCVFPCTMCVCVYNVCVCHFCVILLDKEVTLNHSLLWSITKSIFFILDRSVMTFKFLVVIWYIKVCLHGTTRSDHQTVWTVKLFHAMHSPIAYTCNGSVYIVYLCILCTIRRFMVMCQSLVSVIYHEWRYVLCGKVAWQRIETLWLYVKAVTRVHVICGDMCYMEKLPYKGSNDRNQWNG